ncbi:MAG: hypothetical protein QNJ98_01670 [Planctomycetota bacterium]|nr:hypothetical protein [Planctomycetota bacterium]
MRLLTTLSLALIASTATACGGGGSIRDAISEALVQSLPIRVEALTGSLSSDGGIDRDYVMRIGDDARDVMWRGVSAYDLPEPRPGYVLESATLHFGAERFDGDVFGRLGGIYIQRINLGAVLDAGDYGRAGSGWTLALDTETLDVQQIDIRRMVQDVYDAGGRRLDLRFRTAVSSVNRDRRVDAATIDYFVVILNWRRM